MMISLKHSLIILTLSFFLFGCSATEDCEPREEMDESQYIHLTFRMVAQSNANSRTDTNPDHDETDSDLPEFEDRIYTDDFAFYIYAVRSDSEPLIMRVTDITTNTDPHTNISGGPSVFNVRVSVPKSDIDNLVPANDDVEFKIVAFANTGRQYDNLSESDCAYFDDLMKKASEWSYNIFGQIYPTESNDGNLVMGAKIPMYGITSFKETRLRINNSRPDAPIKGDDMSMLRSVSKVKVIDAIQNRDDETGLPRIESVTFTTATDMAYMLPYDAANYANGYQVETANPCDGTQHQMPLLKTDNTWSAYIPEQKIGYDNNVDLGIPMFRFKVACYERDGIVHYEDFEVPMNEYKNNKFDFGDFVLRNHIYTLQISGIDEIELICQVDILPYKGVELDPDFGFKDPTPRPPVQPGTTPPWTEFPDPNTPQN